MDFFSTLRAQLNMAVGESFCGAVLQPHEQGALFGCMASWKKKNYVDILRHNMEKSSLSAGIGHHWVFQQDKKYVSKFVWQFLKDTKTKVLEWPSQTPGLIPIEIL